MPSSRSRAGTHLAVTAIAVLSLVSACTSGDDGAAPDDSSGAASGAAEQVLTELDPWPAGTWVGDVAGTEASIAVVAGPDGVAAYVCDDEALAEWFRADVAAGTLAVTNTGGAGLVATLDDGDLVGEVRLGEATYGFRAVPGEGDVLHRAEGFDEDESALAGWITLPSGQVKGTLRLDKRIPVPVRLPTRTTPPTTRPTPPITVAPTTRPAPPITVAPTTRPAPTTVPPITVAPTTTVVPAPAPAATSAKVVKAPALVLAEPVKVPKQIAGVVPELTLTPPTPVTPDTVAAPTPNATSFVWTALGDSYGSGEGAPVRPGEFTVGHVPLRLPDWGEGSEGVSDDELQACHRSSLAGAPVAAERLRAAYPEVRFSFAHYACSGAESFDVINPGYDGPDRGVAVAQPAQGQRAAAFAADKGGYDAVYLSIGGNDAGFGDVIAGCLTAFDLPALGLRDCEDEPPVRAADPARGRPAQTLQQAFDSMPAGLAAVHDFLGAPERPARPRAVLVSQYPDPTTGDGGVDCGDGEGRTAGDILALISKKEARWARTEVLTAMNDNVAEAARTHGWILVDDHLAAFPGHGICATDNLVNTNNDALPRQGDDYDLPGVRETITGAVALAAGAAGGLAAPVTAVVGGVVAASTVNLSAGVVHPNAAGHAAYADAIEAELRPLVEAKLASGLRPPTRVRVAAATADASLTIRWDDRSTSEDRYEVTFRRLEGSGTVPADPVRLPRDAQEVRIDTGGGVAVAVEVRACVLDVCSEPGTLEAANIIPKVPEGGTGEYVAVIVPALGRTTTSVNAGWLASSHATRYVVEHRQVDPAGPTGTLTPSFPAAGVAIAEPSLGTDGNPKARYALRIAACNLAGCSRFSPPVEVDARGEPKQVVLEPTAAPLADQLMPELLVGGDGLPMLGPRLPGLDRPSSLPSGPSTTLGPGG